MKWTLICCLALVVITVKRSPTHDCAHYSVASIQPLAAIPTADLIERDMTVTKVDLSAILGCLLEATWHSEKPIDKGGHYLRVDGFSDLRISYYGGFFWVVDHPGYYQVTEANRKKFEGYFHDLLVSTIIPWRHGQNNSEQNRAPDALPGRS